MTDILFLAHQSFKQDHELIRAFKRQHRGEANFGITFRMYRSAKERLNSYVKGRGQYERTSFFYNPTRNQCPYIDFSAPKGRMNWEGGSHA